jgi:hypothetical protein
MVVNQEVNKMETIKASNGKKQYICACHSFQFDTKEQAKKCETDTLNNFNA